MPLRATVTGSPISSRYTGTSICFPSCSSWSIAAGRCRSAATRPGLRSALRKNSASFAAAVVFPDPCNPASRTTVGGRELKARPEAPAPISAVSSSWTIFTTCCAGVRLFRTSCPSARSRTWATNDLTTSKLTSASSSASRISRIAREIASSSSVPRLRRSPRALWSRSERASNTAAQCTCGLFCARLPTVAERKLATVLFADLAGSTALADEQDPERTRLRLERFYDAMKREIETAGGRVEKFAGDAVMAAFGAPEALEDHAERALHAALAMQRRLEQGLALRIGINTGEVVVAEAREGSSFVSGDAVNVAARLEQAAEPGEILAGERTVAAARGAFEFGNPKAIEAKGKPASIPCRPVIRALSLMRTRGVGGLARAFVGRAAELERLQVAYRRAVQQGRPVLVTLLGDAGVGKTRLMRELWECLGDEEPEPVRRTGRCLAYGQGITYWPLAEVLKEHLAILESDPPDEVRRRLGPREILGLTLGLDVAGDLHPLAARDRLHAAWLDFLTDLAAERPVVVLVEDVHWAEEPLLDLLERLARDVSGPLLLL